MSAGFGDFRTALRFREAVAGIAEEVVNRLRPTYRYAEVRAVSGSQVTVRFPGETTDVTVAAGSIIPSKVGQTVRVAGVGGERYVSDVLGLSTVGHRLTGADTRSIVDAASKWSNANGLGRTLSGPEFKTGTTLGLAGGYYGVVTVAPWEDDSGGGVHQLAFGSDGELWRRYGTRAGAWGAWGKMGGDDTGWITPTFQANYSDYGGIHACRYRRLNGVVFIKGLANCSVAGTTTPVFYLPAGFRPSTTYGHLFIGQTGGGSRRFDVRPGGTGYSGDVTIEGAAGSWNSLECSFPAGA